jgi:hypothetical protein
MHHLLALFAGCLLYPPPDDPCHEVREAQYEFLRSHGAQEIQWNENGTVRSMKLKGIFLPNGLDGFQRGQPAPELLEKIGPALLAAGTEELRVWNVSKQTPRADPTRPPDLSASFQQFIRGREVRGSWVRISVDIHTNEVTSITATFLPDRGLNHEPRLTGTEARKKLDAELREIPYQALEPAFYDTPPRLAYAFEQWGPGGGVLGGALVWVFEVTFPPAGGEGQFGQLMVDAATGKMTPHDNVLRSWNR